MSLDHQVFESNTYNQFFGDEEQTLGQGMGQSLNNTLGPASVSGLSSGLVSGLNYDVGVTFTKNCMISVIFLLRFVWFV